MGLNFKIEGDILARNGKVWEGKERLKVFAQRLEKHMVDKKVGQAQALRERLPSTLQKALRSDDA